MHTACNTATSLPAIPTYEDPGLTLKEVAALLRVHPDTVRRLVKRGDIRAGLVGSTYRILRRDLRDYCERVWQ